MGDLSTPVNIYRFAFSSTKDIFVIRLLTFSNSTTYHFMTPQKEKTAALVFSRQFTKEGISPYDMFDYDRRTSVIKNPSGKIVFQMDDVEVPRQWSQIATDILAQKYFRRAGVPQADGSTGRETTIKQVAHRMAHCWRVWGERYNYFATINDAQIFYDELVYSLKPGLRAQ